MKLWKLLAAALIALFAVGSLTACSSASADPASFAQIIDVRTSEEWSTGYVEGAIRIGIADADFSAQIGTLDPTLDYFVYCRSGNRAGQAIEIMKSAGFTGNLVNGGSVANAASMLGLSIVTD